MPKLLWMVRRLGLHSLVIGLLMFITLPCVVLVLMSTHVQTASLSSYSMKIQSGQATPTSTSGNSQSGEITSLRNEVAQLRTMVEGKEKDSWDKLSALSGLVSGILVAAIGALATYIYNKRQNAVEGAKSERELSVLRVQTVQTFMSHLQSGDEREKEAALLAIHALGNSELASKLAAMYRGQGAVNALSRIATSSDEKAARSAEQSLKVIFDTLRSSVVQILDDSGRARGTGFVVRSDGVIMTADYIISNERDYKSARLSAKYSNGEVDEVTVLRVSKEKGLGLLKVDRSGLSPLPIGQKTQDLEVLSEIIVLGYRLRIGWQTTIGRITGMGEVEDLEIDQPMLLAELAGDRGYGGAPVVDRGGMVIGVFYATERRPELRNLVFLLPSSNIHDVLEELDGAPPEAAARADVSGSTAEDGLE